ncbi:MAG: membrane protein insertase YidC [Chromatiales bacterium]|nr:membrane protein insertase YidC [Chromatiales bacterium]
MDNLRIFLWVGLLMLIWLTVQTWQTTFAPKPAGISTTTATPAAPGAAATAPVQAPPELPALAEGQAPGTPALAPAATAEPVVPATTLIRVRTDVLDLAIDARGGNIVDAKLPTYPVHKDQPNVPVELLSPEPSRFFAFQGGLRAAGGQPEANHLANFTATGTDFTLEPGATELKVPLRWESPTGVVVTKTYTFRPGRFQIDLDYTVENNGAEPYQAAEYLQLHRLFTPHKQSMIDVETYSFNGPVTYDGNKYQKLDVEDLAGAPFSQSVPNGWFAAIQHHFLAAAVPPAGETWNYAGSFAEGRFLVSAIGPLQVIPPAGSATFSSKLFVGPKLQSELKTVAPGLELTVDYGRLTLLAQPMFWLLDTMHGFVRNWGLAIILVTLLIKLVFYKLSETSGRSMAGMRKLQPRMKALQERYKDDRQAMSTALMELYKKEKINPAAGCLPMLVQIPFFISFYWVLLESVEMRQAPFALWITDLSSKDPFFILPLLMGAAMFFQQKLNPPPPDPVQAKMMQIMPIVFTGFFAFFPAGLVLYWLTNSVLSMAQQWRINKVLGAD